MALSTPAVRALYERGSFDAFDTTATAGTVVFFAIGIPMWGVQQILARGFYAREEMWAPVAIGTISTAVALPVYWALQRTMGVDGLALASTLAISIYTGALAVVWYRRTGWEHARPLALTTAKALPATVFAGVGAWYLADFILDSGTGFWVDAGAVSAGGIAVLAIVGAPRWIRRDLASSSGQPLGLTDRNGHSHRTKASPLRHAHPDVFGVLTAQGHEHPGRLAGRFPQHSRKYVSLLHSADATGVISHQSSPPPIDFAD
jgi:hypothetical protein